MSQNYFADLNSVDCKDKIKLPLTKSEQQSIVIKTVVPTEMIAPVKQGEVIGQIEVACNGVTLAKAPLYAQCDVNKANVIDYIRNWLKK